MKYIAILSLILLVGCDFNINLDVTMHKDTTMTEETKKESGYHCNSGNHCMCCAVSVYQECRFRGWYARNGRKKGYYFLCKI